MKELKITSQFKKDLKKYQNQPKRIEKLKVVLTYLQQDIPIPQEYKPHKLLGEYKDYGVSYRKRYPFGLVR